MLKLILAAVLIDAVLGIAMAMMQHRRIVMPGLRTNIWSGVTGFAAKYPVYLAVISEAGTTWSSGLLTLAILTSGLGHNLALMLARFLLDNDDDDWHGKVKKGRRKTACFIRSLVSVPMPVPIPIPVR